MVNNYNFYIIVARFRRHNFSKMVRDYNYCKSYYVCVKMDLLNTQKKKNNFYENENYGGKAEIII